MKNEKPNIFFLGEKNSWKKYKLKEISNIYDGTHQTPKYTAKGIPFVSVENINDIYNSKKFISVADYESNFKNKTEIGNLFMTRITAGVIGATAVIETNKPIAYYVSLALIKPCNNVVDSWFLNYVMSASRFKKELNKRIIHTAFPKKINLADIGTCNIYMPLMNEQKKIGSFFKDLEDTIDLHQQELDALKQTKQGFLQKMFPKEGENVPEIRFEGFSGEWESKTFSLLVTRISKQSNSDILPKLEFEDIISGEGKLNKDISNKFDNRKGILFEPGYILFGKLRPYLKNWLLPDFKGIALGDFWVFTTDYYAEFIYSLIQTSKFQTVANLSSGTKMPRSDWKTVSSTEFLIPSMQEQVKIGEFFRQLDEVVDLKEQELEALKQTKQGFLQKMFV